MAQATAASSSASSLASRYSVQALEDKAQELVALYSDLEAVQATLTSLPQSLKHRVTVPVGKLAFTRGTLERTNEVIVNLGGGLFAKQSAFQACGVLERRKATVQADIRQIKAALAAQHGSVTSSTQRGTLAASGEPRKLSGESMKSSGQPQQRQAPRGGSSMKEDANGFVELRETLEEAEALSREAVPSTSSAPRALTEEERAKSRAIWDQFAKLEEENDPEAIAAAEAALDAQEQRERAEAEMSMDEFYANFLNQGRGAPQEAPVATSGRSSKTGAADEMVRKVAAVPDSGGVVGSSAFSGHVMERETGSLEPPRAPASSTASGSAPSAESTAKPKRVSLFKKNLAAGKST